MRLFSFVCLFLVVVFHATSKADGYLKTCDVSSEPQSIGNEEKFSVIAEKQDCYIFGFSYPSLFMKIKFHLLSFQNGDDKLEIFAKEKKDIKSGESPLYTLNERNKDEFKGKEVIVRDKVTFHTMGSGLITVALNIEPINFQHCRHVRSLHSLDGGSLNVLVNLHGSYSAPPIVEAWTIGDINRHKDTFSTSVKVSKTTFVATIVRTDKHVGWGQEPQLCWNEQEKPKEEGVLSTPTDADGMATFSILISHQINKSTAVDNSSKLTNRNSKNKTTLEDSSVPRILKIPTQVWTQTPSLTEISENVYDVFGREIFMSTILDMFEKDPNIKFPVFSSEDPNTKLELSIRGDTIYLDRKTINLNGLKKLTIYCRRLIAAENTTVSLDAPIICGPTTTGNMCDGVISQATDDENGLNGTSGADTPLTNIYAYQVNGNIKFTFKASDGNRGQDGGDGSDGDNITYEQSHLPKSTCTEYCERNLGKKTYEGYQGYTGGDGKDGRHGGNGGHGGKVSDISLTYSQIRGSISFESTPGLGGKAGGHGNGGNGGHGGTGGCGIQCHSYNRCGRSFCQSYCSTKPKCDARGATGPYGSNGRDGYFLYSNIHGKDGTNTSPNLEKDATLREFAYIIQFIGRTIKSVAQGNQNTIAEIPTYPNTTLEGKDGTNTSPNLEKDATLREFFADQEDLLKLIKRYSESMFQRNQNTIAEEISSFLLSVTYPNTTLHNEVSQRLRIIRSGFDYYGNTDKYAPDFDWSYLSERSDDLLEVGRSFEEAYNSIKDKIDGVLVVADGIKKVAKILIKKNEKELEYNKKELKTRKDLNYKCIRNHELTMKSQLHDLKYLLSKAQYELKQPGISAEGLIFFIGGIVGMAGSFATGNFVGGASAGIAIARGVRRLVDVEERCKVPSIEKATKYLEEKLKFAYEYEKVESEDLDFSTFDVSMVSEIMKSNLAKNKASLIIEFKCFLGMESSETADQLSMVLDNFFRDADLRISLIDKLINIDIQLKEISNDRKLLEETNESLDAIEQSEQVSLSMDVKKSFTGLLFSMYQQQENTIMKSIYELSKAYQFESLWNFNVLDKYNNIFSGQVMTSNLGALEGIQHLDKIRQSLEDERNLFLNQIKSAAGPSSHVYVLFKEFNQVNSPDVIGDLQQSGSFTIRINLDPNDIQITGCQNCYNQRLESMYIEIIGEKQNSNVPTQLFVRVAHMGDSYFLVPAKNGGKEVILLQQSPENIEGGHIMTFDSDNLISSSEDLDAKFEKEEHQFCEDNDDFFTQKPCKSPYSTFVITIPRSSSYGCTLNPTYIPEISGINCKDLDFSRFTSVKFYANIKSWSHYPAQPDNE